MGYRAFMLAIQNQVSVLTKILETKIQQQQIVEYQQAVSVSLNNITSPKPSRSRKLSSNQDGNLLSNIKDKKLLTSTTSNNSREKMNEVHSNAVKESRVRDINENKSAPESTGCVIS